MNKQNIPKFKNLSLEEEFWQEQDSNDFLDWSSAKRGIFPNLKTSYSFSDNQLGSNSPSGIKKLI